MGEHVDRIAAGGHELGADGALRRAQRVIVSLLGAADSTRRFLGNVVERHDLTLQQYNVLRILRGAGPEPLPTMEIVERMIEKTPGVTRFLDALEERGLVRRERSPQDRRLVHASITDRGLERLRAMDAEVDRADRAVIVGLSPEAIESALETLATIRRNVEGAHPEGGRPTRGRR